MSRAQSRRGFLKGLGAALGGLLLPSALVAGQCSSCGANGLLELPGSRGWACPRCGWRQLRRVWTWGGLEGDQDGWFHVTAQYDGSFGNDVALYVDGDLVVNGERVDDGYIHTPAGHRISKVREVAEKVREAARQRIFERRERGEHLISKVYEEAGESKLGFAVESAEIDFSPDKAFTMSAWMKLTT